MIIAVIYVRNLSSCKKKAWKTDIQASDPVYQCSALPNELSSQLAMGVDHFVNS